MSTQKHKVVVSSCHGHDHTEEQGCGEQLSNHGHEHPEEQGRG